MATVATRRTYGDSCGMAQALDVVGERWALLVVRELLLGPRRFTDLRADLPGISSNVLTDRLMELEGAGVLRRRRLPPPAGAWVYELTEWGAELEPVIIMLGRWGVRSPSFDREAGLSVSSVVLSQRTMFDPAAARGVRVSVELRLGDRRFVAEVDDGRFTITPVEQLPGHPEVQAVVTTATPQVLAGLLYDGLDLDTAIDDGLVVIDGNRGVVERYLTVFALPEPAEAGSR